MTPSFGASGATPDPSVFSFSSNLQASRPTWSRYPEDLPQVLSDCRHIVVKIGSQILVEDQNIAEDRMKSIIDDIATLHSAGKRVVIVTSAAIACGRHETGNFAEHLSIPEKQALASIGQPLIMDRYRAGFGEYGIRVAQGLVTADAFANPATLKNMADACEVLHSSYRTILILNENDFLEWIELREAVETSFEENDKLSAIVAGGLGADILANITKLPGIYTGNPSVDPHAELLRYVPDLRLLNEVSTEGKTRNGRGGGGPKIEAAKVATWSGVPMVVLGYRPGVLSDAFIECSIDGTYIPARTSPLDPMQSWLAFGSGHKGIVVVRNSSVQPLLEGNADLSLPDVVSVDGDFLESAPVSIQDEQGNRIGKGIIGRSSDVVKGLLDGSMSANGGGSQVIPRDEMVFLVGYI